MEKLHRKSLLGKMDTLRDGADAMEMSLWQFFLARRAFKKSAETWQKLWRKDKPTDELANPFIK